MVGVRRFFSQPIRDYLDGLLACFHTGRAQALGLAAVAFLLSWWIYVPIHELSHAYGCMLAGGTVTRLEISPLYGAAWLQQVFPFVTVGSEYAGRLSGFDTHASDWIYLATDAAPFLWTILIGVPLLRGVSSGTTGHRLQFGLALPIAFAPFISLTGDYYEMGSILVSRVAAGFDPTIPLERWRSDDVFRLIDDLSSGAEGVRAGDVAGIGGGLILGTLLALGTYWLGVLWSDALRGHRTTARHQSVA